MPTQQAPSTRPLIIVLAFVVLLPVLAATPALAQRNRTPKNSRGRTNEAALRDASREHMTEQINKVFEKQRISLLPQIKEDFARMQVVNNEMMRAVFDLNTLDYNNILDTSAEIRKRAGRLKTNLRLPALGDEEEKKPLHVPSDDAALKELLLLLDDSIMSFVKNPLFQKTEVLDTKLSAKASRDLKAIIELSGAIRQSVGRLNKPSAPHGNPVRQR